MARVLSSSNLDHLSMEKDLDRAHCSSRGPYHFPRKTLKGGKVHPAMTLCQRLLILNKLNTIIILPFFGPTSSKIGCLVNTFSFMPVYYSLIKLRQMLHPVKDRLVLRTP